MSLKTVAATLYHPFRRPKVVFLLGSLIFFLIANSSISQMSPRVSSSNSSRKAQSDAQEVAERVASKQVMGGFATSLEVKESVDFLLVPALLVQEAINRDTIQTFP